jgi:chorismate synthase
VRTNNHIAVASCLVFMAASAGCGSQFESIDMRGSVSVDGQTASAGYLTFLPNAAGRGTGGMGQIQADGSYLLRRVPLGPTTFTLAPQRTTGRKAETTDPRGKTITVDQQLPMIKGGTFAAGQTTVVLEVARGMVRHDFELTSDPR